jgi:hypothetical protein
LTFDSPRVRGAALETDVRRFAEAEHGCCSSWHVVVEAADDAGAALRAWSM